MGIPIHIIGFGTRSEIISSEYERYSRLLKPFVNLKTTILKSTATKKGKNVKELTVDTKKMLTHWDKHTYAVGLTEEGKSFDSINFAQWLDKRIVQGDHLVYNIGGAYGLSPEIKKHCNDLISLSPLTFPHRLCFTILIEQLYRAFTILKGHPYHK